MLRAFCLHRLPAHCRRDSGCDISRAYLGLFYVAAAVHSVLPLQHAPVLLEVLAKGLEGLLERFQSGTDLVISSPSLDALP